MRKNHSFNLSLVFIFLSMAAASAETVRLKSGQEIQGKILEKTDKFIYLEQGKSIENYPLAQIESIDGKSLSSQEVILSSVSTPKNSTKANAGDWQDWNKKTKSYLGKSLQLGSKAGKIIRNLQNLNFHKQVGASYDEVNMQISNLKKEFIKADKEIDSVVSELELLEPPQELMAYHSDINKSMQNVKSMIGVNLDMFAGHTENRQEEILRYRTDMIMSLKDCFSELKTVYSQHNAPQEEMKLVNYSIKYYDDLLKQGY